MAEVKIDPSGKVVLPRPVREAARLAPGSVAEARVTPEGLLLVPKGRPERKSTLWGLVSEERKRMKKGDFLTRGQTLALCERALDALVSDEDLR